MTSIKENLFCKAIKCRVCENILPYPPNPIFQAQANTPLCLIGQAPGMKAHNTSKAWNDASGDRLRSWLKMDKNTFYDSSKLAILPMSFCYPGKGKQGDLPPIKACAPLWHSQLLAMINPKVTLLVGKYAQDYYLQDKLNLTNRLQHWQHYLPNFIVLPHPSPRNNIWLSKNVWFEQRVLPAIQGYLLNIDWR
jgi:uracil-DNA glycosylase family 4